MQEEVLEELLKIKQFIMNDIENYKYFPNGEEKVLINTSAIESLECVLYLINLIIEGKHL